MVERPIKKSERQAVAPVTEEGGEAQETESPAKRDTPKPVRAKDKPPGQSDRSERSDRSDDRRSDDRRSKGKGKGKRGSRDDDQPKAPASLATMRGPRPVKAPVEESAPEVTEEAIAEESTEEAPAEEVATAE